MPKRLFQKRDFPWGRAKKIREIPSDSALQWKPLGPEDAKLLTHLVGRIEGYDNPPYRTTLEEVEEVLSDRYISLTAGGFDTEGVLRAFSHLRLRSAQTPTAICSGGVDPCCRGRGSGGAIVQWQEYNARVLLAAQAEGERAVVCHVEPEMLDYQNLLADHGFSWTRTYYELRRRVEPVSFTPILPPFVEIQDWDPNLAEDAHQVTRQVADQIIGFTDLLDDRWEDYLQGLFQPGCALALDHRGDRPRVIGVLMCSLYEADWDVLGWREGYIDFLAVLPEYSGQEVAKALVAKNLAGLHKQGFERVATGVETTSGSRVLTLFSELGFETSNVSKLFSAVF